jgi:DNA-nicking Smr family endonuclease
VESKRSFLNESCVSHYEELRARVITGTGASNGLAVVLRGGVAAWMRVLKDLEVIARQHTQETHGEIVSIAQDEIVHLIANIVSNTWRNAYAS